MLGKKFFACCGTGRLAGGTFYDPLWWLQVDGADGYAELTFDGHFKFALDFHRALEISFVVDFRDWDDFLGAELGVVDPHGDGAAVVNGRMAGNYFFDVLRINIFTADDDKIFFASNDI